MKLGLLLLTALAVARAPAQSAAVAPADSVFDAELMKILVQQSRRGEPRDFPSLTLSAQYSRHRPLDEQHVYQRGPYEFTEQVFRSSYQYRVTLNADPHGAAAAGSEALLVPHIPMRTVNVAPASIPWYVCGMVVKAPQVGETPEVRAAGGDYFVRLAGVPVKYENDTLWLLTLLQHARVGADGVTIEAPVVYKKLLDLHGSESVTLQIPPRDPSDETVEEVTLTHEPPQGFGLAQNVPEPADDHAVFAYAVPAQCAVRLTVAKLDGTPLDTLVHGIAEAGVYRRAFDANRLAPGAYVCQMEATPTSGGAPYLKQLTFTRAAAATAHVRIPADADSVRELFPVTTIPLEQQRGERVFRLMVEGGAAYLDPRKASSPFDNMFSHVALAIGFALTPTIEAGVMFGQDGFHEPRDNVNPIIIPSTDEAIQTRVVPWAGGYGRVYFSGSLTRGFFHASVASSSEGVVSTFGVGFAMTISSGLSLFLLPHRTDLWIAHPSTKWGADYGIAFLF